MLSGRRDHIYCWSYWQYQQIQIHRHSMQCMSDSWKMTLRRNDLCFQRPWSMYLLTRISWQVIQLMAWWEALGDTALSKFDKSALVHGPDTMAHYEDIMRDLAYYAFPHQALQEV
jgi:hypothetical protein